jgi:DNA-binding NarL/FixJ family response regulator
MPVVNHVLCGLAANSALPSELLDRLIADADADAGIAANLADRADLSRTQIVALAARCEETAVQLAYEGRLSAADIDPETQPLAALALLHDRAGSPEWPRLFAADPLVERRVKLAACPGLPPDVVETLATDSDIRVVAELALWTTRKTATRLAEHPHAEVRLAAAANEATPPALLGMLITGEGLPPALSCLVCDREEIPFVHEAQCPRLDCELRPGASCDGSHESTVHETQAMALRNPAAPSEGVADFADHPSMLLRCELAARPDLLPEVCGQLASDPIPGVRAELAANPAIDDATIRILATDRGHDVRRRLAHNPQVPLDLLTYLAGATKIGPTLLPRIAAASPAEVEELARSSEPTVRMLVAERRDLPAEVRDALAADAAAKVVKSIAPHPGLSEAQLRNILDRYGTPRVLAKVAANPDVSPALLEELTRREPPARRVLREVARHRNATAPALLTCLADRQVRPIAAAHPALPPPLIAELLTDDDWRVVEGAAANASLPLALMAELVPLVP